jgi:hypothetical protein
MGSVSKATYKICFFGGGQHFLPDEGIAYILGCNLAVLQHCNIYITVLQSVVLHTVSKDNLRTAL